jgi:glyoxylase-like metal-dependent hydrolase (beta-lactamase superfamily II)
MRARVVEICRMYGLPTDDIEPAPEPKYPLVGGESLALGAESFVVYHTPGHSPGHLSFYQPDSGVLIAGDLLFQGSVGRTDLPGGSHEVLLKSIAMLMRELPPSTRVLSGHGPDTTLEVERRTNPFLVGV